MHSHHVGFMALVDLASGDSPAGFFDFSSFAFDSHRAGTDQIEARRGGAAPPSPEKPRGQGWVEAGSPGRQDRGASSSKISFLLGIWEHSS